jgi:hypothetical protein
LQLLRDRQLFSALLEEREMTRGDCAQPVAVAQFGAACGSGVARAALRCNWSILDAEEPGLVRWTVSRGVRVLIVQLDAASDGAIGLIQRLSLHWNPVRCVVVGPVGGADLELAARRAGAAAYVPASTDVETIEALAASLAA